MMPQCIIRNSVGDASRHHQGVKGSLMYSAHPPCIGYLVNIHVCLLHGTICDLFGSYGGCLCDSNISNYSSQNAKLLRIHIDYYIRIARLLDSQTECGVSYWKYD